MFSLHSYKEQNASEASVIDTETTKVASFIK